MNQEGIFFFGFEYICPNHQKRRQLLATLVAESRNHILLLQVNKQNILVYVCLDSTTEPSPLGHGYVLVIRSNTDSTAELLAHVEWTHGPIPE